MTLKEGRNNMTSMKYILSITFTLISVSSFAGGGGGGGVLARVMALQPGGTEDTGLITSEFTKTPEIVFNLGQNNGSVKFAYGQLVNKKWQIENLEMTEADLMTEVSIMTALEDSKINGEWIAISPNR